MRIVVQKFGGTSLACERDRLLAAKQVARALDQDYKVVVTVSAMGRKGDPYATDTLLNLVEDPSSATRRDLDLLMSCGEVISAVVFASLLRQQGHQVTVLNGQQAGILTDNEYGDAEVQEVDPKRIWSALDQDHVVVVTGYQGVTVDGFISTLGRGGSDTTALVLGAALGADYVDIFTDVDGVMTADPRIVPNARKLHYLTYSDTYHLASHGAKVLHPRSVAVAERADIPIRVRNMYSDDPGTLVSFQPPDGANLGLNWDPGSRLNERPAIPSHDRSGTEQSGQSGRPERSVATATVPAIGVAQISGLAHIQVYLADNLDSRLALLQALQRAGIAIESLSHLEDHLSLALKMDDAPTAERIIVHNEAYQAVIRHNCARITVVGTGLDTHPATASYAKKALQNESIEVVGWGYSDDAFWCLVHQDHMKQTMRVLHEEFTQRSEPRHLYAAHQQPDAERVLS